MRYPRYLEWVKRGNRWSSGSDNSAGFGRTAEKKGAAWNGNVLRLSSVANTRMAQSRWDNPLLIQLYYVPRFGFIRWGDIYQFSRHCRKTTIMLCLSWCQMDRTANTALHHTCNTLIQLCRLLTMGKGTRKIVSYWQVMRCREYWLDIIGLICALNASNDKNDHFWGPWNSLLSIIPVWVIGNNPGRPVCHLFWYSRPNPKSWIFIRYYTSYSNTILTTTCYLSLVESPIMHETPFLFHLWSYLNSLESGQKLTLYRISLLYRLINGRKVIQIIP